MALQISIISYVLLMIFAGLWIAKRVKTSEDYVLAGRSLPFYMALATVFATWFGSESILGASSKFVEGGLSNVLEDPFGSALCLIIAGLFFNRKLYKLKHLTIGDYFKSRYNTIVSVFLSVIIIISYFGWVGAQILALSIVASNIFSISLLYASLASTILVVIYTYFGGMWSVALLDTIQSFVIILGLAAILFYVLPMVGGLGSLINQIPDTHFQILPNENTFLAWSVFLTALMTQGFGSIPQQDVYQRAMSANSANASAYASILGGIIYFAIVMIPLSLAYVAYLVYPHILAVDAQNLIPTLVMSNTPVIIQILFFGALLSAILSTASGAMLAPSTLLAENVIKPFFKSMSDSFRLKIIRTSVLLIAVGAYFMASGENAKIYDLVSSAYSVTLVAGFIPLVFGLYSTKINSFTAIFSIVSGISAWRFAEYFITDIPPTFIGFLASLFGIILGYFLSKFIKLSTETIK